MAKKISTKTKFKRKKSTAKAKSMPKPSKIAKKTKISFKPRIKSKHKANKFSQTDISKQEITKLKKIEIKYKNSRKDCLKFKESFEYANGFNAALLRAMPFAVDIVDKTGKILYMNDELESVIGKDSLGKKCWLKYKDDKMQCRYCPLRKGVSVGETAVLETNGAFGGKTFYITHTGMVYKGQKAVLEIFQDMTERKNMEDALRSLSVMDELTNLYNRRGFFALAGHQLSVSKRRKIKFSLIYIDIDNMKNTNDRMGHLQGDKTLLDMAKVLKHTCRESDIAARIGGDEFVILAVEAGVKETSAIISRLKRNIDNCNAVSPYKYKISISLGKAYYHHEETATLSSLLEIADKDMYANKNVKKG